MNNFKTFGKWLVTPQPQTPLSLAVNLTAVTVGVGITAVQIYNDRKFEKEYYQTPAKNN